MGIRFDRDSRRATNGPMIFFSILKDETFEEEIRNAFISGLSFYAYRFPNDSMMSYGSSEGYMEGIGTPGFVIGMYDPEKPFITIPYDGIKRPDKSLSLYEMPLQSTSYEDYSYEVEEIIKDIKEQKGSKVVAARTIVEESPVDIAEKFYDLCQKFPEAFVYCFSTPATGCWVGASPELLLSGNNFSLHSMALAGTRPSNINFPWDEKNLKEQKIVSDYICEIFENEGLHAIIKDTYTKSAGAIEHICTPIEISLPENYKLDIETIIRKLSPTPALCGFPKEFALKEIKRLEKFDRGCYGGFCGPFHSLKDFHFNVVLRGSSLTEQRECYYIGGGITAFSNVSEEWKETQLKYQAMIK